MVNQAQIIDWNVFYWTVKPRYTAMFRIWQIWRYIDVGGIERLWKVEKPIKEFEKSQKLVVFRVWRYIEGRYIEVWVYLPIFPANETFRWGRCLLHILILFQELPSLPSELTPEVMNSNEYLFMLYTSGSTGRPKGVAHTQAGYLLYAALTHQVNRVNCTRIVVHRT